MGNSRKVTLAVFSFAFLGAPAAAQPNPAVLHISVDASQAPQKIYHARVRMPAAPGPFTFEYPKWIPGYHAPVGPIEDVVSLRVSAGGSNLEWRRDLVDFYAVHATVPAGASEVVVDFDVVSAPSNNGQLPPTGDAQIAMVEFSEFAMYPQGMAAADITADATLRLPSGWTFGTALPVQTHTGDAITFAPASLYTLVDSPVIAGAHEKALPLGGEFELDAAADSEAALDFTPKFVTGMKHLVAEGPALYGGKHFRDYHFLLTLSDPIGIEGIEHHESSDNRAPEKYASDDDTFRVIADLLPHEFSHSWNGKYRRPADLATADFQQPEQTDLLWVYEGLNQYLGETLSTRARLNSFQEELDTLAMTAADMDIESGRTWRSVRDTADAAPILYPSPRQYYELRRNGNDFYSEGDLIWLDADVTIRRLTHGAKSLDDFCRMWGDGTDQTDPPRVRPYAESDVYALLNTVVPYDWAGFFKARIATVTPRADLDGITGGGYKLVYTDKASEIAKAQTSHDKQLDVRYSIGLLISTDGATDGTISDVLTQSPAFSAGLAPGMRILAVDGRRWSDDVLRDALRAHKGSATPLQLIVDNDGFIKDVQFEARDGERYPHLERTSTPDELAKIYAPRTFVAPPEPKATP